MKSIIAISVAFLLVVLTSPQAYAQTGKDVCAVYFTYVGCPHCAYGDPAVLVDATGKYPGLVVIEYEFVLVPENSYVLYDYNEVYECGAGVPMIIFSKEKGIVGDTPILQNLEGMIKSGPNDCPLLGGYSAFRDVDIANLPGKPKIWTNDRILIKEGDGGDNELLKELLTTENISAALEDAEFEVAEPEELLLSGSKFPQLDVQGSVKFENAIKIGDWTFQWNGEDVHANGNGNGGDDGDGDGNTVNGGTDNAGTSPSIYYLAIIVVIIIIILVLYFTRSG